MSSLRRLSAGLLATATSMLLMSLAAPAAQADRCQPEELLGVNGIVPEPANPVCLVMDEVVYPALGCPPPTTLMSCQTSIGQITANAPSAPQNVLDAASKAPTTASNLITFINGIPLCVTVQLNLEETFCVPV